MYNYKNKLKALVNFSYTFISPKNKNRKAPLWNFLQHGKKGGITVEAAAVCSLAIIVISAFLFLFLILRKEFELKQKMYQIQEYQMLLENENGKKEDYVDSVSVYLLGINKKIVISNLLQDYGFDGYNADATAEKVFVYVTQKGTVYHRDKECLHLKLVIQEYPLKDIPEIRNLDGGKYYPCEMCGRKFTGVNAYVTPYGERYHSKRECNALKRTICAVLLEEVQDMEECKDCGNG